jgi:hypothetical protein
MCDAAMIREYGLLGAFDTVINMLGERVAIVTSFTNEISEDEDKNNNDDRSYSQTSEEPEIELEGIMYAELQCNSIALATQLHYRFAREKENLF